MTGESVAHNSMCNLSRRTTIPDRKGKGEDDNSRSDMTLVESVMTTGGIPTPATAKFHATNDLEEEEDAYSFYIVHRFQVITFFEEHEQGDLP